jgi:hypothetical protein
LTNLDFEIKILDLHWINNVDDPTDLCAHGHVFVKIGNEIVCDSSRLDVAVSSTALYLMRTVRNNYAKGDFASQLLPCCGHFIIADEDKSSVQICGCPSGIDWTIIQVDDRRIRHTTENGQEAILEIESYKRMVLEFVEQVEQFYDNSLPKTIPTNEFDKDGYLTFWKEWKNLKIGLQ